MFQDTYYVPKRSGTLADSLLAYGLATVLRALIQSVPGRPLHAYCPVRIEDQSGCYAIRLPEAIREEWLATSRISFDLARAVKRVAKPKDETKAKSTAKHKPEKKGLPDDIPIIDYNAIWDGIRSVSTLIEAQRQQGRINWKEIEELRDSLLEKEPNRDVALLIGEYRMQVEGIHNQAVIQWCATSKAGYQAANLRAILQLFASPQADSGAVAKAWAKEVKLEGVRSMLTASQVYNPSMGKGQNHPKANKLAMGNEDNFWLLEYLKAVGIFVTAAPRAFADEDMRKTYVLAPANIELNVHEKIFGKFTRTLSGLGISPIKADVLTALDYGDTYLSYCRERKIEDPDTIITNPRNIVMGFYVADYVLLSQNSFTLINLAFLGLPPWLNASIRSRDDVDEAQAVIAEHSKIIRDMREKKPDGKPHPDRQQISMLLDTYRDFLTGQRIDSFFRFCADYGEFVVRKLIEPENRYIRQISITSLDQIFRRIDMPEADLTEFISISGQHDGFHNIAYAIRHSTIIPQRQLARLKANDQGAEKPLYDVRYGLANNLRRKTDSADDFISALTEFIQIYNAETVQVYENTSNDRQRDPKFGERRYRKQIAIDDLDDVLALVKTYSVPLVCNMLLAYGYATQRGKRDYQAENSTASNGSDETTSTTEEA